MIVGVFVVELLWDFIEGLRPDHLCNPPFDGARHSRAAWSYEAPRPAMQQVAHRFGFWEDVKVA